MTHEFSNIKGMRYSTIPPADPILLDLPIISTLDLLVFSNSGMKTCSLTNKEWWKLLSLVNPGATIYSHVTFLVMYNTQMWPYTYTYMYIQLPCQNISDSGTWVLVSLTRFFFFFFIHRNIWSIVLWWWHKVLHFRCHMAKRTLPTV